MPVTTRSQSSSVAAQVRSWTKKEIEAANALLELKRSSPPSARSSRSNGRSSNGSSRPRRACANYNQSVIDWADEDC